MDKREFANEIVGFISVGDFQKKDEKTMTEKEKELAYKAINYIETELTERTLAEHMPEIWDELEEILEEVRKKVEEAE
jgi:arsenate reductase-like glutaredoxin family protein